MEILLDANPVRGLDREIDRGRQYRCSGGAVRDHHAHHARRGPLMPAQRPEGEITTRRFVVERKSIGCIHRIYLIGTATRSAVLATCLDPNRFAQPLGSAAASME